MPFADAIVQVPAHAELIHRFAERAGDRIARKVCLDDGDVDAGGR